MYALIVNTPDDAHCIAVASHESTLRDKMKEEAMNFLKERMSDEDIIEGGWADTIAKADKEWSDEDEEYPYKLHIEQTDWLDD